MPFLDLEEVLGDLGYGTALDRRDFFVAGIRVFEQKPPTPERLVEKRASEARRAAAAKLLAPRRSYRRHAPGTPNWKKCDLDKKRLRARTAVAGRRARAREERMMTARTRFEDFLKRLDSLDLVKQAEMVCVGRDVLGLDGRPDVRRLYESREPECFEARLDFFVWLRHPLRSWSASAIGELFDFAWSDVRGALASRTKYAGEDLDDR